LGLKKLALALWENAAGCIILGGGLPTYLQALASFDLATLAFSICETDPNFKLLNLDSVN